MAITFFAKAWFSLYAMAADEGLPSNHDPALAAPFTKEEDLYDLFKGHFRNTKTKTLTTTYKTDSGLSFIIDWEHDQPLLKYLNKDEVFPLKSAIGPRGDKFLRLENGQLILRITDLGGAIFYGKPYPNGIPAEIIVSEKSQ